MSWSLVFFVGWVVCGFLVAVLFGSAIRRQERDDAEFWRAYARDELKQARESATSPTEHLAPSPASRLSTAASVARFAAAQSVEWHDVNRRAAMAASEPTLVDSDEWCWTPEYVAYLAAQDVATFRTGFTDCGLCGRDTQGAAECPSCMRSIDRFYDEPAVRAD